MCSNLGQLGEDLPLTGLHDCMWSLNWRAVRLSFMKIQLYCLNYTNLKKNIA